MPLDVASPWYTTLQSNNRKINPNNQLRLIPVLNQSHNQEVKFTGIPRVLNFLGTWGTTQIFWMIILLPIWHVDSFQQHFYDMPAWSFLTHWGRVTHICVGTNTNIGSDNGLSPGRRQAIIWTNAGILLIGPLGTNFNEMLIEIHAFSFTKIHLKMSSGKWRPFCLGLNVLT